MLIDDYHSWPGRAAAFADEQSLQAICSAPMLWNGQVTGVIYALRSSPFTQPELELLTLFANHAAIAVENARLIQQFKQELAECKQVENRVTGKRRTLPVALRESTDRSLSFYAGR